MTGRAARRIGWPDGFGVRLGLVLSLALLPVGAMGVMQSADLVTEARARSEAALAGETLRAVRPRLVAIQQAQGAAEALAGTLGGAGEGGQCGPALDTLVSGSRTLAFAGLYDAEGAGICLSDDAPPSFAATGGHASLLTEAAPTMAIAAVPDAGRVLAALHPRSDQGGLVTGFAAVAPRILPGDGGEVTTRGFVLILFDRQGQILDSAPLTGGDAWQGIAALLPEGRSLDALRAADVATFSALSVAGDRRAYSLVRLIEGELYALGSWPVDSSGLLTVRALPAMLFPFLMWAVSLIAAWAAAETLVTRHIRRLRTAITAFAGGDRAIQPLDMQSAPREIRETADAFARMTETILHDEAELEDSVHQKEILLREVHHRVKNNLQLIASIVNMQIRRTSSEEARRIMRSLQDRMLGLATIHNGLYQTADLSEIAAEKLFPGIIEQIVRGAQSRGGVRLVTEIDPVQLPLDRAVPLALLLTEALSNAMRHATAPEGEVPVLAVSFRRGAGGEAVLEVTNSAAGPAAAPDEGGRGIGQHLLRGFARQLGGQVHREFAEGLCKVRVWFLLDPAEPQPAVA